MARLRFPRRRPDQWFNKRGAGDVFALTATMAYHWHARCPCHVPAGVVNDPSGRGEEGRWAAAWLDWLTRTHLAAAGFTLAGAPSKRVVEIRLSVDEHSVSALQRAVVSGNATGEQAPAVPLSMTRRR